MIMPSIHFCEEMSRKGSSRMRKMLEKKSLSKLRKGKFKRMNEENGGRKILSFHTQF